MNEIHVKVTKFSNRKNWLMYYDCPLTGKRITQSTKQTTKSEAEKAAGKWEAELREGRYKPKSNVTWPEFRQSFLESLIDAPTKTYASYLTALNTTQKHLAVNRLAELTARRLEYVADQLRSADKSAETIASYLRHIRAALNWAHSKGMLSHQIKLTMPKRQKGTKRMKGRPITGEEFERMLEKVESALAEPRREYKPPEKPKRVFSEKAIAERKKKITDQAKIDAPAWKRFLRGLWLSGLRLGEAIALTWDDDDSARVVLSGRRPMLLIRAEYQKGQRDTLTPITPDFAELLLTTPKAERVGPVFILPDRDGKRLTDPNIVSRVVSYIGEKAGVVVDKDKGKFASAHDLRRSFGVRWSARVMPAVLKDLMRHEDIDTTMRFYVGQNAEATADAVWDAMERINGGGIKQNVNSGTETTKTQETDNPEAVEE